MDIFFGSWKLVKSENLDDLLKASGVEEEKRDVIKALKPVVSFSPVNHHLVFKTQTIIGTKSQEFKLGEEFQEESVFGAVFKTVVNLEGENLVQMYKYPKGQEVTVVREIQNGSMIVTMTCDEATAVLTFEKA